jgi:chemotaxis protein MotB
MSKQPSGGIPAPIIIIKKKGGHGGHHGGAWKVAYADFVTAMMALFIVLWLLSSSEEVKKAVGGYFQDPTGSGKMTGSTMAGGGEGVSLSKDDMSKLKQRLEAAMKEMPTFQNIKKQVQIIVTGEGLRIELLETDKGTFFESGRPQPTESGKALLVRLAEEVGKLPNKLLIEGHTDSKPFGGDGSYTNWELSVDRANQARRLMQSSGVRADQVAQVRGYADQRLRHLEDPENAANRRISVIIQYLTPPAGKDVIDKPSKAAEGESHKSASHH